MRYYIARLVSVGVLRDFAKGSVLKEAMGIA